MNFHDQKRRPRLTPDVLLSAFDEDFDQIVFHVGGREFLVLVRYDERPIIKCALCVETEESDGWTVLDDTGENYRGEELPPPWQGSPEFVAMKIISAAHSCCSLAKTPPRFASIDHPDVVVLGDFAVEPDAALVYDRTAMLTHAENADSDFPREESEQIDSSDEIMRQLNALKGRGRLQ
jgi:hypothetical protein